MVMSDFSDWLDREMSLRGLTLRDVAEEVGVSWSTVRSWRKGWTAPDFGYTAGLAKALAEDVVRVRQLLGSSEENGEQPDAPEITELVAIARELQAQGQALDLQALLHTARALRDYSRNRARAGRRR